METIDALSLVADTSLQTWHGTFVVGAVAFAVATATHWLGSRVLRRVALPYPRVSVFLRSIRLPALAVLVIFALQFVLSQALDTLRFISGLRELTAVALIASITWLSLRCAAAIGETIIAAHPLDAADNLQARRIHTQARVLARTVMGLIMIVGTGAALMNFPNVRQFGTSLLASAGVAGLVAGIAARPVLANMIAGLQIALTQPIRLDDVVVIQGEWGRVEEITGTYVSLRLWDQRRMIVPLQWFIENPFANWTRSSSQIIGTVFLWLDFRMPLAPLREELTRIVTNAPEWDGRVQVLQVTDANERAMQLRVLVSSRDSGLAWDLRCRVREGLLGFVNAQYPQFLPRTRAEMSADLESSASELPGRTSRPAQPAASSTAANTEADPVTGGGERTVEASVAMQAMEKTKDSPDHAATAPAGDAVKGTRRSAG
ncbi:mechanosensitive ion channel family protein [Paraburkholderia dinghuensis]|uniref:Mechanosensitive ion channel family protein n=1 Tax=Paraburkholderia dinghuensis TaxID=2305225 RepID=A0A3N6NE97_9BURK|nr:mechanosensitive ion channel family protein [Paraburkholderia dinghuensis]RQH07332.1 mechanosensitive ion channel family protein [Paraburkholderia dinghuensis]